VKSFTTHFTTVHEVHYSASRLQRIRNPIIHIRCGALAKHICPLPSLSTQWWWQRQWWQSWL